MGCRRVELSTPVLVVYHPVRLSHTSSARLGSSAVKWLNKKVPERFSSVSPIRLVLRAPMTKSAPSRSNGSEDRTPSISSGEVVSRRTVTSKRGAPSIGGGKKAREKVGRDTPPRAPRWGA